MPTNPPPSTVVPARIEARSNTSVGRWLFMSAHEYPDAACVLRHRPPTNRTVCGTHFGMAPQCRNRPLRPVGDAHRRGDRTVRKVCPVCHEDNLGSWTHDRSSTSRQHSDVSTSPGYPCISCTPPLHLLHPCNRCTPAFAAPLPCICCTPTPARDATHPCISCTQTRKNRKKNFK